MVAPSQAPLRYLRTTDELVQELSKLNGEDQYRVLEHMKIMQNEEVNLVYSESSIVETPSPL